MQIVTALAAVLGIVALLSLPGIAAPASAVPETNATGSAGAAQQSTPRFARIVIDSMTPSIITTTSLPVVTVSGRVDNIGDRSISNLSIRLERGDAVAAASGLRTELADDDPAVAVAGPFEALSESLAPGESVGFRMSMALSAGSGPDGRGLGISETGVYPMQVNVNGTPDYGNAAQVAGSRMLLPVLSLPPDEIRARDYVDPTTDDTGSPAVPGLGPDGSISADLARPARMTLLWPLAAPPQLAPGVLGGNTEPVRLINEDMARSLDTGGRLNELLTALQKVVGEPPREESGPPSSEPAAADSSEPTPAAMPGSEKLADSMCLAIDPDLLVTVRAMSLGYEVSTNPADPTSATRPGNGSDVAQRWLDALRWTASRMCVVALPFAQADLTSLSRIGIPGLTEAALRGPADIVDVILDVRSVRGLSVPALGAIDDAGADALAQAGMTSTALASNSVVPTGRRDDTGRYRVGRLTAQTFDAPITASLAAIGTAPRTPALTPDSQQVDLTDESVGSRRQSALAALAYPAIAAPEPDSGEDGSTPRNPVVGRSAFLVPPTYWSPTVADSDALFATARLLLESGAATPTPLPTLVQELGATTATGRLTNPPGVGPVGRLGSVLTTQATAAIRRNVEDSWQFEGALVRSADVAATPERYMSPLREDQLRAIRSPDAEGSAVYTHLRRLQEERVDAVASTLHRLGQSVTILDPGGRYTLASERSPVLLAVRNDLALPVRARLTTSAPEGVEIGDLGVIEIPARGTRQIQLPTRGETSEAITIDIRLATVTGVPLGQPITLQVHTNAYGKPLFYITIVAGVALVLLTARRLWHRFRGQPDPADADRPEPDELERMLAGSGYQERRRTLQGEGRPPGEEPEDHPHDP
ncbi:DUF6049 family protein [Gordonia amicalis]|uniref:DUF6049 family protein n=1 Tax=Gordonia amicalis TaxID=89053 RepID=A0AAE4R4G8_9ACTN|nr:MULTISPECIES: DUF6049 family protein [Gordonia]ATD72757.1 hypothetical protein CNO18_23305 [Gordonia sp. 1D]MCZ4581792.1 DUF6049 family protein [Gordonia amicalis]MDV6310104.1 DUF6049 family protein [Gordonia amicalis]MDV6312924.1 DUF6049 family protein [Gordonia amicalis]MDV7102535.1 DUF6049 family protein [Gordonia amicalis]